MLLRQIRDVFKAFLWCSGGDISASYRQPQYKAVFESFVNPLDIMEFAEGFGCGTGVGMFREYSGLQSEFRCRLQTSMAVSTILPAAVLTGCLVCGKVIVDHILKTGRLHPGLSASIDQLIRDSSGQLAAA